MAELGPSLHTTTDGPHPGGDHAHDPASLPYHHSHVGEALRVAFHATDQELAGTEAGDFVGATAVVAVVGKTHIWVAHCGGYMGG